MQQSCTMRLSNQDIDELREEIHIRYKIFKQFNIDVINIFDEDEESNNDEDEDVKWWWNRTDNFSLYCIQFETN